MLYYFLVLVAVLMFGLQFFANGRYQEHCGSSFVSSMIFSLGSGVVGLLSLLIINGFSCHVTPFTFLMASLSAVNGLAFTFCGLAALKRTNLSVYSVFSMIGGMALPFALGIACYGESLTVAKCLCFAFITVGILLNIDFKKGGNQGLLFYIGIFILNGMSGVLSMIYSKTDLPKGTASDYSVLSAIIRVTIAFVIVLIIWLRKADLRPYKRVRIMADLGVCGVFNAFANLLLLIALAQLPGSLQYPMVSGGVMIVSTCLGFFNKRKPKAKNIISVAVSFIGLVMLLLPF